MAVRRTGLEAIPPLQPLQRELSRPSGPAFPTVSPGDLGMAPQANYLRPDPASWSRSSSPAPSLLFNSPREYSEWRDDEAMRSARFSRASSPPSLQRAVFGDSCWPNRSSPRHMRAMVGEESSSLKWRQRVLCVKVEQVETGVERTEVYSPAVAFYQLPPQYDGGKDPGSSKPTTVRVSRADLNGPPVHMMQKDLRRRIAGITEIRQSFWSTAASFAYHAFTVLDVETCGLYILCERKNDKLEIMIGYGSIPHDYMREFRASGRPRDTGRCEGLPRQKVSSAVTVGDFLDWLDINVQGYWQPYNILTANCQHFAEDIKNFILNFRGSTDLAFRRGERVFQSLAIGADPTTKSRDRGAVLEQVSLDGCALQGASEELQRDEEVVAAAVRQRPDALQYAAPELQGDRDIVMAAVRKNGNALFWATDDLQKDRVIVFAAVRQNGMALRFANADLRRSWNVVFAAVRQDGNALRYASDELRRDRAVVLEAVRRNGEALQYASLGLRADHGVVLAAVRQNADALRFAGEDVRWDRGVLLAASWKDPRALRYAWAQESST